MISILNLENCHTEKKKKKKNMKFNGSIFKDSNALGTEVTNLQIIMEAYYFIILCCRYIQYL